MTDDTVSYGNNIRVAFLLLIITKALALGLKISVCCKMQLMLPRILLRNAHYLTSNTLIAHHIYM